MNRISKALDKVLNTGGLFLIVLFIVPIFIVTLILGEERMDKILGDDDLI